MGLPRLSKTCLALTHLILAMDGESSEFQIREERTKEDERRRERERRRREKRSEGMNEQ